MLNPSRQVVIVLVVASVVLLALGLATDFGLFGWSLAVLIGLYSRSHGWPASDAAGRPPPDEGEAGGAAQAPPARLTHRSRRRRIDARRRKEA